MAFVQILIRYRFDEMLNPFFRNESAQCKTGGCAVYCTSHTTDDCTPSYDVVRTEDL